MSRGVQHRDAPFAEFERVAVEQLAVERDHARRVRQAEPTRLHRQRLVEREVGGMQKPARA